MILRRKLTLAAVAAASLGPWPTMGSTGAVSKFRLKIDDSLNVFAVHGVGGILGTLGVAFLALPTFGGLGLAEGVGAGDQLAVQATGTIAVVAWSLVVSLVILLVVRAMVGLRVDQEDEIEGLDVTAHGERSYML